MEMKRYIYKTYLCKVREVGRDEVCIFSGKDILEITFLDIDGKYYTSKRDAGRFLRKVCNTSCEKCKYRFVCFTNE